MAVHVRAAELPGADSAHERAGGAGLVHLEATVELEIIHALLVLGEALLQEVVTLSVEHARVRRPDLLNRKSVTHKIIVVVFGYRGEDRTSGREHCLSLLVPRGAGTECSL